MPKKKESSNGADLALAQFQQSAGVRISFWRPDVVRIQFSRDGEFRDTGLNRYGFILPPREATAARTHQTKDGLTVASDRLSVRFNKESNEVVIEDKDGSVILRQTCAKFETGFAEARFNAQPDEDWTGFGDQTRERLFHRGHLADLYVRNISAYIPIPFFLSTHGYGVLVNTTHRVLFDMGKSDPDAFFWRDQRGSLDYYVLVGKDFKTILNAYTDLTGKPKLPPIWAFGLWYLFRDEANDWEVVQCAERFRQEGIPCDVLGLEPGWMETNYDMTPDKKWHPQRFPVYPWKKPMVAGTFPCVLKNLGYKLELWLANDYDLSYEAERRLGSSAVPADEKGAEFHPDGIADERLRGSQRCDTLTRPDEPWFEHLKKFVDQGVAFFKLDACKQVYRHDDRIWGNGMADAEMHNLYPLLYVRQMYEGYREYAKRRPFVFNPCGWAGLQAWCATWTGDIGGKLDSLVSILNLAFAAHGLNTNDMAVEEKEMIHLSYLLPLSQINGCSALYQPWLVDEETKKLHVFYSQLRSRLIPYLYSWAYHSTITGCPLIRPLPLEFPGDKRCRTVLHQYLLGRDLMVCVCKKEAYFPEGAWMDVWTGAIVPGGQCRAIGWPADRSGGLYMRRGGIVPFGPLLQSRGEKPLDSIELHVFPDSQENVLEFYEDDGESLRHESGEFAITRIRTTRKEGEIVVSVGKMTGDYAGKPAARRWSFVVAVPGMPSRVTVNGREPPPGAWRHDTARGVVSMDPQEGPVEVRLRV